MFPNTAQAPVICPLYSWTDDLPVCQQSGISFEPNCLYRAVGGKSEVFEYESKSFNFQCPDDCYLYGIFDGHQGAKVSNFASQKLPAELLLGQLKDEYTDNDVRLKLQEAFENVTKGFIEDLISDSLMEKMNLEEEMPEDMDPVEAYNRFPGLFQSLKQLEGDIAGGCSAVIALIHKSRLFVANVGDSRALLCRVDQNSGELGVIQLSTDHTISTMSELQRLANLGLEIETLQTSGRITTTRSLGDWALKGGYKSNPLLSAAKEEPISSIPSVHGGEKINNSMKFLILMSQGVYNAYEKASDTPFDQVNNYIAYMVHQEILQRESIEEVARVVLDKICSLHYEKFIQSEHQKCMKRDDMTLLVRLFNVDLGGGEKHQKSIIHSSKLALKSTSLAPLKIPQPNLNQSNHSTKTTSNNDTPTTTTPGSTISTPGSGGSSTASPQFHPFSHIPASSPLTVTVISNYQQNAHNPHELRTGPAEERHFVKDRQDPIHGFTTHEQNNFFRPKKFGQGQYEREDDQPLLKISTRIDNVESRDSLVDSSISASTDSSANPSYEDKTRLFNRPAEPLEMDENGRIKSYIDFTEFRNKMNALGGEEIVFAEFLKNRKN